MLVRDDAQSFSTRRLAHIAYFQRQEVVDLLKAVGPIGKGNPASGPCMGNVQEF